MTASAEPAADATGPRPGDPRRLFVPLVASLTLGLAPFTPEPHLLGKIRWIAGGAEGMAAMDWFDVLLHGGPWLWLAAELVAFATAKIRGSAQPQ